jgi:putative lipase involved disintegration of autophagic bodies
VTSQRYDSAFKDDQQLNQGRTVSVLLDLFLEKLLG